MKITWCIRVGILAAWVMGPAVFAESHSVTAPAAGGARPTADWARYTKDEKASAVAAMIKERIRSKIVVTPPRLNEDGLIPRFNLISKDMGVATDVGLVDQAKLLEAKLKITPPEGDGLVWRVKAIEKAWIAHKNAIQLDERTEAAFKEAYGAPKTLKEKIAKAEQYLDAQKIPRAKIHWYHTQSHRLDAIKKALEN